MTAKLADHLRRNKLNDFVTEAQAILNAEAAQQVAEVEAVLFKKKEAPTEQLSEALSRKHFQLAADTLKDIPDQKKRKEMAEHHATVFAKANPRFDRSKFFAAAGVK